MKINSQTVWVVCDDDGTEIERFASPAEAQDFASVQNVITHNQPAPPKAKKAKKRAPKKKK